MNASRPGGNRPRKSARAARNTYVTKSGQTIKIHRNLTEKWAAARDLRARKRAERLVGLPKSRVKRMIYRMHPKRLYKYWFSREGGIMALKITGISIFAGILLLLGIFAYFRKDLPNLRDISGDKIGGSNRYYDRTGQTLLFEDYDAVKRIPVQDDQISQYVKSATVAVEDKDFFNHGGFDVRGIARAGVSDVLHRGTTQGGSTITQQLVKLNNDWTKDRTITRKVKELILSVELERTYSKKEILDGYLNAAPYGNVQNGVEAASRDYFQKSAKDLSLDEAAFMAAIPKAPSYYSPYGPNYDPAALKGRQNYILDLMAQQGMITDKQRDDAKKVDIAAKIHKPNPKYDGIKAPYFVLTAKQQLESKYGDKTVKRGGWKVITTLDLGLQTEAENQVAKGLGQVKRQGGDDAAFVAEDVKTGQMVALVGGPDFFADNDWHENNYARLPIPPGSSFKPYDYSALIETSTNVGAGSVLYDSQGPVPGYPCTNKALPEKGGNCIWDFSRTYPGPITLRYAIGGSRNVPAVKAMAIVGVDKTIGIAEKMMTSPGNAASSLSSDGRGEYNCYTNEANTIKGPCYNSSAIGDGAFLKLDEHVHGYATLSRNGNNIPQTYILKITDSSDKTIDEWKPTKGVQAVRPDTAYIVSDMISDPNASYFSAGTKPQRYTNSQGTWKFSAKTGTTNDAKDGLMGGYSTQYAAFVWVGYHTRQKAMSGSMEQMTEPIWLGWMKAAHKNLKPEDRAKPAGVQTLPAYIVRTNPGYGAVVPSPATDLFPSWYKGTNNKTGANRTIDIVSNKGATDCTPARARKDTNDAVANSFSVDKYIAGGALNSDTTQQDDVHKCDDIKPDVSNVTATPSGGGYIISANVTEGSHPLSSDQYPGTVTFSVNGQIVPGGSVNVSSSGVVSVNCDNSVCAGKTVTVTVVDSVLYDDSDIVTVPGSSGGPSGGSPHLSATTSGSGLTKKINFTWTGGTGPYDIYKGPTPVTGCMNQPGSGCQTNYNTLGAGTYKIIDNNNVQDTVTVP